MVEDTNNQNAHSETAQKELTPILVDAGDQRKRINRKIFSALHEIFPIKTSRYTLELSDPRILEANYSIKQQKDAILEGRSLYERLQGTLVTKDKNGKVVDTANKFTLLNMPYFTDRHTFILDGNDYSVSSQIRAKPGVYARRRGNAELEAAFNLIKKKGAHFRISMDPEEGKLNMEYGTTKIPIYPILRSFGVSHEDIASHWGKEVAEMNKNTTGNPDKAVDKLYQKVIPPSQRIGSAPLDHKVKQLKDYYTTALMDPEVNRNTLGQAYDRVTPGTLLSASKKLLDIHRGAVDTDDRDSLEFKTFHSVDDFMKERILLDARALKNKIALKLEAHDGHIRKAIPSAPFSKSVRGFLTTSALSAIPMQINPMELLDQAVRVTSLGEGAISSERAIPSEARNLHATHLGIMDPSRTPETFKAGIDIRTALATKRDEHGNLYGRFRNVKTNKNEDLNPSQLAKSVIAFPGEDLESGNPVDAMDHGEIKSVSADRVTHIIPHPSYMYGPTTNLLPFLNGMQGNRTIMASKHQSQALSLVHREAPLVQVQSWRPHMSVEQEMARFIVPTSPVAGTVHKIDDDYIYIKPDAEKTSSYEDFFSAYGSEFYSDHVKIAENKDEHDGLIRLSYHNHFPLAAKTFLHNSIKVKAGDKVEAGQPLADSNFGKDDTLALGRNLTVGYMAYRGLNSNDGLVVSQRAADSLASEHMYKSILQIASDVTPSKEKHRIFFGAKYTQDQYNKLDDEGVVKKGTKVNPGDILIAAVKTSQQSSTSALLGKLSKALVKPYQEIVELWDHAHPGEVIDVIKTPQRICVTVKTIETISIGDKLAGRYGNKGVIAKIIPNNQMIQNEKGEPIDLLFTSAGINTRINPNQICEAVVGKVADHIGKPIKIENYSNKDNDQFAYDLLKKHGLKDKETVFDPVTGKKIPGVFVGKSYILKIFKTTDSNWSSHGSEKYDVNQQPARGGEEGSKSIGKLEFDSLIAHNARNVLRESATIKSQKNDEFWRAVQLGLPTPTPQTSFAYNKFLTMLEGAGIKINKSDNKLTLGPLTDKDTKEYSHGALESAKMLRAKDLQPEQGGLFDPNITGGESGDRWAHIDLHEPIVNPVFEEPVRRLLGLTQKQFTTLHGDHGGAYFKSELAKIDVKKKIAELKNRSRMLNGTALDNIVKQIKYLTALDQQGLTPDKAYVISKVAVVPPVVRPILPQGDGRLLVGDANLLYRDAILANQILSTNKPLMSSTELGPLRNHLYDAVGAVFGVNDPVSPTAEKRGAKGFIMQITGTRPGNGFFQSKLMKRQQDVSGRATIAPDPTLSMDEIGVPEDMLWGMYSKFVIGRLVKMGYPALDAERMVKEKNFVAREQLLLEAEHRPVMVNRAPSLHRYNIIGAKPKLIEGKTLRLNPFAEKGMNADYDGDAVQIHAPVTDAGIEDVKKMTLSNLIFSEKKSAPLNISPDMESIVGLHRATSGEGSGPVKTFKTTADAMRAYHAGELSLADNVKIG